MIEKIKIDPTPYILEEKLSLAIIAIRGLGVRVYLFRRPGLPGGGGLEKPDIYCNFEWNSIDKQEQTGDGDLKNPIFAGVLNGWSLTILAFSILT